MHGICWNKTLSNYGTSKFQPELFSPLILMFLFFFSAQISTLLDTCGCKGFYYTLFFCSTSFLCALQRDFNYPCKKVVKKMKKRGWTFKDRQCLNCLKSLISISCTVQCINLNSTPELLNRDFKIFTYNHNLVFNIALKWYLNVSTKSRC